MPITGVPESIFSGGGQSWVATALFKP